MWKHCVLSLIQVSEMHGAGMIKVDIIEQTLIKVSASKLFFKILSKNDIHE